MDPHYMMPPDVEAPLTPMGRKPFNRWVSPGAGGGPYEARGWFPSNAGQARLSPGYDGLERGLSQDEAALQWKRLYSDAVSVPEDSGMTYATEQSASVPRQRRRRPFRARRRYPRVAMRLRGLGSDEAPDTGGGFSGMLVLGITVGAALAYITYDETMGTGAKLRRRR